MQSQHHDVTAFDTRIIYNCTRSCSCMLCPHWRSGHGCLLIQRQEVADYNVCKSESMRFAKQFLIFGRQCCDIFMAMSCTRCQGALKMDCFSAIAKDKWNKNNNSLSEDTDQTQFYNIFSIACFLLSREAAHSRPIVKINQSQFLNYAPTCVPAYVDLRQISNKVRKV